ncbi:ornithine cyclodeaminase family protein [Natronosalvus halobius]|uniref:ornithine cyclodeaminase family protein n=1 Tax=Natronosalvus halobius TaxID=2953746 RepID=UPI00209F2E96|nr:ornithine cyclodeaminase family protein [Natronosalvus halobius]USZ73701.1 ornithine cyclodeaminase family protein [Natronosalvus halobius]
MVKHTTDPGELRFLNRDDVNEALEPAACLERVEQTFEWVGDGVVQQSNPFDLDVSTADDEYGLGMVQSFPSYVEPIDAAGHKWLGYIERNMERGLPTINAIDILSDAETSLPVAIMEGQSVTAMRTAGHAAVGAKYLAREDASTVTIVGCGDQGRTHLLMMAELFDLEEVRACDIDDEIRNAFIEEMSEHVDADVVGVPDAEEAVSGADIICTVTSATRPIVEEAWIEPGTHVAATAGFYDLEPTLSSEADKWVVGYYDRDLNWIEGEQEDNWTAEGYKVDENDIHADLIEVMNDERPGRESPNERTVMTHKGMPALDTATMELVHERAVEEGLGTEISLF